MSLSGLREENINQRRVCEKFVSCRVGLELNHCNNLGYDNIFQQHGGYNYTDQGLDFVISPIASPESMLYDDAPDLIPDLAMPVPRWERHVAININYTPVESFDDKPVRRFDKLFRHAIYLPTPVVIIQCPTNRSEQVNIATVINKRLEETRNCGRPFVLFKVPVGEEELLDRQDLLALYGATADIFPETGSSGDSGNASGSQPTASSQSSDSRLSKVEFSSNSGSDDNLEGPFKKMCSSRLTMQWHLWNSMRSLLIPDKRLGVCVELTNLNGCPEELDVWSGEPVRMVILSPKKLVYTPGCKRSARLPGRYKEFLRTILLSNSLMTCFVWKNLPDIDMSEPIVYLKNLSYGFEVDHADGFRAWNDIISTPLQPLSVNLDAATYYVFEMDQAKYTRYADAMREALDHMVPKIDFRNCKLIIMVLGAGRGPLVDATIEAIKGSKRKCSYKIYALDKNPSSVCSLRHKQKYSWSSHRDVIETVVVEADMRLWEPVEKADIIATELLGSFSDNELSPECIDGTWRFATDRTISIPQSYTSHLAPICSYRLFQEVYSAKQQNPHAYDQIYVVRLSNFYTISRPQDLFKFEHLNLSARPSEGSNQRYSKISFPVSLDTICHGFAGYFSARLFGKTSISILPQTKTPAMDSWFPVFIPLEEPVELMSGGTMDVQFWRKETSDKVWYEWQVTRPKESRIHSLGGINSAMSKFIM